MKCSRPLWCYTFVRLENQSSLISMLSERRIDTTEVLPNAARRGRMINLFPAVVQAGGGQGAAQQAPCGIHALVQQIGLIPLDIDVHRLFGAVSAVHGVPSVAVGGLGLVLLTGHPDRKPGGVQLQPVEGAGQTQFFDLLGEVCKKGAEVHSGQAEGHNSQHGGQQAGTLPLAKLAQADAGTHQQNGGEYRRALPALVVAQQVKRCKIVKALFVHLDGNANILGHKVTLLFGHSTTFIGKKQAKDAPAAYPACKPPARRGKIGYYPTDIIQRKRGAVHGKA